MLQSKSEAIALIKGCPPVRDRFTALDDPFFNQMLDDSAATLGDQIAYRWRYVAARFLQVNPDVQLLSAAQGASFTRLETPIAALLGDQVAEDTALMRAGWTIPAGWLAISALNPSVTSGNSKKKPIIGSTVSYRAGGY